jgi:hypothetical protein
MANHSDKHEWALRRAHMRREMSRILEDIHSGEVVELDVYKLHNYVMTSLMLLSKIQPQLWDVVKKEAELASLIKNQDYEIEDLL